MHRDHRANGFQHRGRRLVFGMRADDGGEAAHRDHLVERVAGGGAFGCLQAQVSGLARHAIGLQKLDGVHLLFAAACGGGIGQATGGA